MTDPAAQILATFSSLSADQQHELLVAMLRQTGDLPAGEMSDEQLVSVADALLCSLDEEESHGTGDAG